MSFEIEIMYWYNIGIVVMAESVTLGRNVARGWLKFMGFPSRDLRQGAKTFSLNKWGRSMGRRARIRDKSLRNLTSLLRINVVQPPSK